MNLETIYQRSVLILPVLLLACSGTEGAAPGNTAATGSNATQAMTGNDGDQEQLPEAAALPPAGDGEGDAVEEPTCESDADCGAAGPCVDGACEGEVGAEPEDVLPLGE